MKGMQVPLKAEDGHARAGECARLASMANQEAIQRVLLDLGQAYRERARQLEASNASKEEVSVTDI